MRQPPHLNRSWRPLTLVLSVFFSGLALLAGLFACSSPPVIPAPEADGPPRLLIISSLIGYIEPCGCTVDLLLGGIDRLAAKVAAERAQGPTAVLVVGSTFYEAAPPEHRIAQDDAKADLLSAALAQIGADVLIPGAADFARGEARAAALFQASGARDLRLSDAGGQGQVLTLGALKVGVFGLSDAQGQLPAEADGALTERVRAEAERLRAEGATVVVALSALPRARLRPLAQQVEAVDLWVLGEQPQEAEALSPVGTHSAIVEAGDRGRNLGRLLLHEAQREGPLADPVGERARAQKSLELQIQMRERMASMQPGAEVRAQIAQMQAELEALRAAPEVVAQGKHVRYQLLPIREGDPRDAALRARLKTYNEALKNLNLSSAGPPALPEGGNGYLGNQTCAGCHPEAMEVWKGTRHARAWATLIAAEKTYDADCVSCHVTGYMQPGGSAVGHTQRLEDVQCEACHGPGQHHVAGGGDPEKIQRLVPESHCQGCHNQHHSPTFNHSSYLPKILGPGHGRPLE